MLENNIIVTGPILTDNQISEAIRQVAKTDHHSDEDGHHIGKDKPNYYPMIADIFGQVLGKRVDPNMIFYHSSPNAIHDGSVEPHEDLDFCDVNGVAKYSMLIHLNDKYEGGETMFGDELAPKVPIGGALIFPHSLTHSGKPVTKGSKFVLKTDVYV